VEVRRGHLGGRRRLAVPIAAAMAAVVSWGPPAMAAPVGARVFTLNSCDFGQLK